MSQVQGAGEPQQQLSTNRLRGLPAPGADFLLHVMLAVGLVAGLLLFYGNVYAIHQDLAGSALSGRLANMLGASFRHYSIYFPPVEWVWFSTADRIADLSGMRLDLVVVAMTSAAILFSTSLAYRIRRLAVGATPAFLIISTAVFVVFPILFMNAFGLREHLVALGLWPYLVLRISDRDGTRIGRNTRLLVGLWLGATLLFKYLYSVTILLVELVDAAVQRRPMLLLRIENIVAGAVVALYLLFWLGVDPSQRASISIVVSAIDANLADPRLNLMVAANNLYFAIFFLIALPLFKLGFRESLLGVALLLGAVVAAWAQGRWYSHHLFPVAMAYLAWWWMVGTGFKWWAHFVVAAYLLSPTVTEFRKTEPYQASLRELDQSLAQAGQSVAGKKVGVLTMHPSPYNQYLAAHHGTRWISSMNNSYVAAELKPLDREENAGEPAPPVKLDTPGRRILHDEMLRLWEDMPPDVLILDHSYRWPLRYLDVQWLRVFAEDQRFNAIMNHYRPVYSHRGKQLKFTYYIRKGWNGPQSSLAN